MSIEQFAGQWLGAFESEHGGIAQLDLDNEGGRLKGMVYAFENDPRLPNICASVNLVPNDNALEFDEDVVAFHPQELRPLRANEFEDVNFPKKVSVCLDLEGDTLSGRWSTDTGATGKVNLDKSEACKPSQYTSEKGTISWDEFQSEVSTLVTKPYRYVFRGQSAPWRLRTSFHRTRRKDLFRYWNDDIPRVRHASVGETKHVFSPVNPDHNGAFMHLLQHHGYPTPMLDWTYSPYIAAFFAYSSASYEQQGARPLRIFMFDAEQWKANYNQVTNVTLCRPHLSLIEPLALGNPRALPQQSVATITNLDDIEDYIKYRENETNREYLRVFDLEPSGRNDALRQLGLMGISPGSMFPGLEGVCREYRDRHFGHSF